MLMCGTRCKQGYVHNNASEIIFAPADVHCKECDGILIKIILLLEATSLKTYCKRFLKKVDL